MSLLNTEFIWNYCVPANKAVARLEPTNRLVIIRTRSENRRLVGLR